MEHETTESVGAAAALEAGARAVTDPLDRLEAFALARGNSANAERLHELAGRFHAQTFNLVVFGEFKRGKTTFINSLIGDDLLPSAVVPLTSVVTLLHYAPSLHVEVEFLDGRVQEVTREDLAGYVTEKGNPENGKGVKVVRVGVPSELLRNGMQLVDTPGVGSVYDHNTETARDFLPQVDGAILLVGSDPPISRGECEFLLEMRPHVARLFVVQNKIDQLRSKDLEESLAFTHSVLHRVLGDTQVEVFPISARDALEGRLSHDPDSVVRSGLPAFEDELRRFQAHEQARTLVVSVVNSALQVAEDEQMNLNLERQALRMSVEEIERRYADFVVRRDRILAQREDDTTLIRAAAHKLIQRTLQKDYDDERTRQAPILRQRLLDWAEQQSDVAAAELLERANEFVKQTLFQVLSDWRRAEERHLEKELSASLERFTQRTNEALGAIYDSAREVFELPPRSVETVGYLAAPSRFLWRDWDWEPRLGLSGSLLVHLLPGARQRVIKASLAVLLDEHDKACGRLRHDFAQRAQVAFGDYIRSLNRSLEEALAGIDRAIHRVITQKQNITEDAAQAESRVLQQAQELGSIVEDLRSAREQAVGDES
jgi:GTPase SAR1 family protein